MSAALEVVRPTAVSGASLYAVEEHLAAMVDSADSVSAECEQKFRADLELALTTAAEKRDRVGQFLAHLEQQIAFAKSEIDRLKERKAAFERAFERLEAYVVEVIERLGTDAKGQHRKLEGRTTTFSLRSCPPSVAVNEEARIPQEYKALVLKLPAVWWERLLDSLDVDQRAEVLAAVRTAEVVIDKRALKAELDSGAQIAGATLIAGRHSLRRT